VSNQDGSSKITQVLDDSCAQDSGLFVGDVVIAIDDAKVGYESLVSHINKSAEGAPLKFSIMRDQVLRVVFVNVSFNRQAHCTLTLMSQLDSETMKRQNQWFYGTTR
jgi:predicted metalloprotease with PDZ domain